MIRLIHKLLHLPTVDSVAQARWALAMGEGLVREDDLKQLASEMRKAWDKRDKKPDDDVVVRLFREEDVWGWELEARDGRAACGYEESADDALRAAADALQHAVTPGVTNSR